MFRYTQFISKFCVWAWGMSMRKGILHFYSFSFALSLGEYGAQKNGVIYINIILSSVFFDIVWKKVFLNGIV